jgi:hypothetical protein
MRLNEHAEPEDDVLPVPTVEGERHFMAQCEYVNSLTSAAGRHARKLLRNRGWCSVWSEVDEEEVWQETFADGTSQSLGEWDAFYFEQDAVRDWFRSAKLSVKPRRKSLAG